MPGCRLAPQDARQAAVHRPFDRGILETPVVAVVVTGDRNGAFVAKVLNIADQCGTLARHVDKAKNKN